MFQYSDSKPAPKDPIHDFWKQRNQEQTKKAVEQGKASLHQNGPIPSLNDAYKPTRPVQETKATFSAEEKYALALGLPPNDPLRQEAIRRHFNKP